MPSPGENYKAWPPYQLRLSHNLPYGPWELWPVLWSEDEMVDGRRVQNRGVAILFLNLYLQHSVKVHDQKAGFRT